MTNDTRPLRQSLPIALLRAREAVMSRFRPLLAERGFTEQQWRVLRVLNEFGPMDPSDIAEHSVILKPSITRILRTLEDQGMVVRSEDPKDGRRFVITLTPPARAAVQQASQRSNAVYTDIETAFGHEEMNQLLALLNDLARSLDRPNDR